MGDLTKRPPQTEDERSSDLWAEIDAHFGASRPDPRPGPLRRVAAALVATVVAVAAFAFLVAVFRTSPSRRPGVFPTRGDATLIDLEAERYWHGPLVAGDGVLWVVASGSDRDEPYEVLRIDPVALRVTDRISLRFADTGRGPAGLAAGGGSVWVSVARAEKGRWDLLPGELLRVDVSTGRVERFAIPPAPGSGLALGFGSLWLAEDSGKVARIDPTTGRLLDKLELGRLPGQILPAFGSLWVIDSAGEGTLVRLDPAAGEVLARFPSVTGVSAGEKSVWLEGEFDTGDPMRSVDPGTNDVSHTAVGSTLRPAYVVQGEGQTWLRAWDPAAGPQASDGPAFPGTWAPGGPVVQPIDPATGASLAESIRVCRSAIGRPVIAFGALWLPCASKILHLPLATTSEQVSREDETPSP